MELWAKVLLFLPPGSKDPYQQEGQLRFSLPASAQVWTRSEAQVQSGSKKRMGPRTKQTVVAVSWCAAIQPRLQQKENEVQVLPRLD